MRETGALRSCCRKTEKRLRLFFSQECPRGSLGGGGRRSFCWFICFIHALVTSSPHSSLLSLCSRTHTNFPLSFPPPPEKHKLSTYKSSIPTTSFLLLLPFPGLTLALAGPHPVPGLFTLLPSIMQGLISQSRFELRHASAKSGEQNFCAGGSFPFTLA